MISPLPTFTDRDEWLKACRAHPSWRGPFSVPMPGVEQFVADSGTAAIWNGNISRGTIIDVESIDASG